MPYRAQWNARLVDRNTAAAALKVSPSPRGVSSTGGNEIRNQVRRRLSDNVISLFCPLPQIVERPEETKSVPLAPRAPQNKNGTLPRSWVNSPRSQLRQQHQQSLLIHHGVPHQFNN